MFRALKWWAEKRVQKQGMRCDILPPFTIVLIDFHHSQVFSIFKVRQVCKFVSCHAVFLCCSVDSGVVWKGCWFDWQQMVQTCVGGITNHQYVHFIQRFQIVWCNDSSSLFVYSVCLHVHVGFGNNHVFEAVQVPVHHASYRCHWKVCLLIDTMFVFFLCCQDTMQSAHRHQCLKWFMSVTLWGVSLREDWKWTLVRWTSSITHKQSKK